MNKTQSLAVWLDQAVDTPWMWGRHDCTLFCADWVVRCGNPDPAAQWRDRYKTALGAARLVTLAGGMEALFSRGAVISGLLPAATPIIGDVGLLSIPTHQGFGPLGSNVGGVCIGGGHWAVPHARGLWMGKAAVSTAWRVKWLIR